MPHAYAPLAAYAGLLGLLYLYLCFRVVQYRFRFKVELGDGGHEEMTRAIRVQANFIEYVPLALVLIALLVAMGTSRTAIHVLGAALLVGRLAHAQGLSGRSGASPGRGAGTVLTWASLAGAAVLCLLAAFGIHV